MSQLTTFLHPNKIYQLQYPSHWETLQEDEGRACGFGPKDRDDVGLWISLMPMSIDTEKAGDDLNRMFEMTMQKADAKDVRTDSSLRHRAVRADVTREGQGGYYWLIAGGDVVLFASTQVPISERDKWNPIFDRVMSSLKIMRDEALLLRRTANEVLRLLTEKYPEMDYKYEDNGIKGKDGMIYLSNLFRDVKESPKRWKSCAKNFFDGIAQSMESPIGNEQWKDVRDTIYPVLKPIDFITSNPSTQHIVTEDWLDEVLICYVIKSKKMYRYLTAWDANRWEISVEEMQERAKENLAALPWPERMEGAKQKGGGRIIIVHASDDMASSRILHPELHPLFAKPLGNPFWAGIPNRSTLVLFSDRRALKKRIARQLKKDHDSSAHSISPRPYLVTADGIALGVEN